VFPHTHIDDFKPGEVYEYGAHEVTQADIIAYAEQFDPQPFHTDPDAAKGSFYGGLIAAGLHTASIFMRLLIDAFPHVDSKGSPGWDEVRWIAPVRPGDVLSVRTDIEAVRHSRSRPELGILTARHVVSTQHATPVFSVLNYWFVGRRDQV